MSKSIFKVTKKQKKTKTKHLTMLKQEVVSNVKRTIKF